MEKMIDRLLAILNAGIAVGKAEEKLTRDLLRGVEVVEASNVARMFYEENNMLEGWFRQFSCLAPPWSDFWIEWHRPPLMLNDDSKMVPSKGFLPDMVGAFFQYWEPRDDGTFPPEVQEDFELMVPKTGFDVSSVRWLGQAVFWILEDTKDTIDVIPDFNVCFALDKDGRTVLVEPAECEIHDTAFVVFQADDKKYPEIKTDNGFSDFVHYARKWFFPVLKTLELLHCDNIVTRLHAPSRLLKKVGRPPAVVYRTLEIDPTKTLVVYDEHLSKGGKKPLHLCRGHIRDCRNGRGLFGKSKWKKTFWIPEHTRGDPEVGVVIKDYRIV